MSQDLLLDTNILLWIVRGDRRVKPIREFVEDAASTVTVSSVALTEVAIKHSVGKLPDDVARLRQAALDLGMLELAFDANHVEQLAQLPMHHRDPFDRMLIAQALAEDYTIATSDRTFRKYAGLRLMRVA